VKHLRERALMSLFPSLTDVAFLLPIVFLFGRMQGTADLLADGDTGWHLRTGEWILANGRIPDRDLFSFTRPDGQWFAWEWLWDVIFGWLHLHGGMAPVVLANTAILCATFALLYRLVRRRAGALTGIAVTACAVAASSIHWLARPHLFTLLFVVIWCGILESDRPRRLLVLPPLMLLWANLHGGFIAGLALLAFNSLGELALTLTAAGPEARAAGLSRTWRYSGTLAACFAVTLINPYGWNLHLHILEYFGDSYLFSHTEEFMSLSFHHPAARWFEAALLAGGAAAAWSLARRRWAHALMIVFWAHMALFSGRNIPIYVAVSALPIALSLEEWLGRAVWLRRFFEFSVNIGKIDRIPRFYTLSAAGLGLVAVLLFAPNPPEAFRPGFSARRFPVEAVARLGPDISTHRIFTHMQWGDYLIYRGYPTARVYIDGRGDYYGSQFVREFLDTMDVSHTWETHLDRYGVDTVLLPASSSLAGALKETTRWRLIHDDGHALTFRRPAPTASDRDRAIAKLQPGDVPIAKNKS